VLLHVNCIEFNSRDVGSFINIYTDSIASLKAAWSPFEILLRAATGAQGS
jgi:hypothetical protein